MAASTVNTKKRKRCENRIWSKEEETELAIYLSDKPYLGREQAKETLKQYENRMLLYLKFPNCDLKRLSNKIVAMKKKYAEVCHWISQTGQGVASNNSNSFSDVVKSKCHYFYILHERLGTSQAVNTSYQRHEGTAVTPDSILHENSSTTPTDAEEQSPVPMYHGIESPADLFQQSVEMVEPEVECTQQSTVHQSSLQETLPPVMPESDNVPNSSKKSRFSKFLAGVREEKVDSRTSAIQKLMGVFNAKCDNRSKIEEAKLDWEKEKWEKMQESDAKKSNDEVQLQIRKMELEYAAEIKKTEINKELELKRIGLEERRLQLEEKKLELQLTQLNAFPRVNK